MYLNGPKQKRGSCYENIGVSQETLCRGLAGPLEGLEPGTGRPPDVSLSVHLHVRLLLCLSICLFLLTPLSIHLLHSPCSLQTHFLRTEKDGAAAFQRCFSSGRFPNPWGCRHIWQMCKAPPILRGCHFSLFIFRNSLALFFN